MKEKPNETRIKRLSLEELIKLAKSKGELIFWSSRGFISNCEVPEFYDSFLTKREDSRFGIELAQDWISSAIEEMLGFRNIKKLTMRELANGIAEAINKSDISSEDRWALYELCFLLTAQMCVEENSGLTIEEQTSRQGTPGEDEPRSLYRRVISGMRSEKKNDEAERKQEGRVNLKQLLGSVKERDVVSEGIIRSLPGMKADIFLMMCMNEKMEIESGPTEEMHIQYLDFINKVEAYCGYVWDEKITVSDFAGRVTREFIMTMMFNPISRREVMEIYELCYEFINLMADKDSSRGHVTLMASEVIDKCNTMQ